MANIQIAIINESSFVSDSEVAAAVAPLQKQISSDFAPLWGADAELRFIRKGYLAPSGCWQLVVLDNSDQAAALGYHDVTPNGMPVMKVFAETSHLDGVSWTSVASHELLEALADPWIDSAVFVQKSDAAGRLWPLEVCDPVEGDLYHIDGIEVSDFVTPQWFMAEPPAGCVFDFLGLVTSPFEVRPSGYMEYYDVTGGTGWQQINATLSR